MEIKPVVEQQFIFKVVYTHQARYRQYILIIVGNLLRCHLAKNYINRFIFDKVIAKTKMVKCF